MMKKRVSENIKKIKDYKDLVKRYEGFGENIAFKFKKNGEIKEITYKQYVEDIKKVAEKVLDSDVQKIAVIGNNRYEWCITYLGVTTAGKVIVPLDKALTDIEIGKLLKKVDKLLVIQEKILKQDLVNLL